MTDDTTTLDLGPAARAMGSLLDGVAAGPLTAATPCAEYSVGDLLDHIMGLTVAFRHAAAKTPLASGRDTDPAKAPSPPGGASAARLHPEWRRLLPGRLDELVTAWREPAAWTGSTEAGGVTLPADIMGVIAANELVIHGWDLARATGQPFDCDPRTLEAVFAFLSASAEEDGPEDLFGPVVPVPADAPLLDRAVGLSGRDPAWRP